MIVKVSTIVEPAVSVHPDAEAVPDEPESITGQYGETTHVSEQETPEKEMLLVAADPVLKKVKATTPECVECATAVPCMFIAGPLEDLPSVEKTNA